MLRLPPFGVEPTGALEPLERDQERARLHLDCQDVDVIWSGTYSNGDRLCRSGEIPALVHPFGRLLATGVAGPGRLPGRVDPADSIPDRGDCGRRSARAAARHRAAAGAS